MKQSNNNKINQGLEEGRPYLQLGDITLEGTVDETIGTHLLFEMQDRGLDSTNILSSITPSRADTEPKELRKALKYECSTENVITLETVTLTPKSSAPVRNSTKEGGNDSSIIDAIF